MNARNAGRPDLSERLLTKDELAASPEVFLIKWGLVYHIVCAPASMSVAEVEAATNARYPTGIDSRWAVPDKPVVGDDRTHDWFGTNKLDCPDCAGRSHYILCC